MIPRVLLTFIFLILIVDSEFAIDAKTRLHTDLTYPYSRESKTVTELFSPLSAPVVALTSVKINTGGSSVSSSYNLVATFEPETPNQTIYNWMIKPEGADTYEPIKVLEMNMNGGARESGKVKDYINGNNGTENRSIIFRPHRGLNDGSDDGSILKGKDSYVSYRIVNGTQHQNMNTNYGSSAALSLDYHCHLPQCYYGAVFIQFNISELPVNISNAYLKMKYYPSVHGGPSMRWNIHPVKDAWDESTITYNNKPTHDAKISSFDVSAASSGTQIVTVDITGTYNKWKSGELVNNGLAFYRNSSTTNHTIWYGELYSSDHSEENNRPYLEVFSDTDLNTFYLTDGDENGMGAYSCNGVDHIELDNAIDLSGKTVYMKIKRGSDWEHIISIPDRTYINGTEQDYDIPFDGKNIGVDKHGAGFNGIIDRVVVYNRVLSAEQITLLSQGNESTILNSETLSGETWKLCVTTNDNTGDETEICSNEITIQQPEIDQVKINNLASEAYSFENLTTEMQPESSTKLIYNWQIDDGSGYKSVKTFDMPMNGGAFCEGKVCEYARNLNGTISGGVSYISDGGFDGKGAYSFDGTGGSISVGGLSDFNYIIAECNFTISLWARTNEPNGSKVQYFMGSAAESASDRGFFFGTDGDGKLTLGALKEQGGVHIFNFESKDSDGIIFEDTDFHHVVVTCDYSLFGSDRFIKYYVDGELKGVGGASNSGPTNVNASRVLTLGRINGWPHGHFNGVIDEVKIWNRVLSPTQIKANYQNRSDNIIVSVETEVGDKWRVKVTPNDNVTDGEQLTSNEVLIKFPQIADVKINNGDVSASGVSNLESETVPDYESKVKKIYNWHISTDNGSTYEPIKVFDMPMDGGKLGENGKIKEYINGYDMAVEGDPVYDSSGGYDGKGAFIFDGDDQLKYSDTNSLLRNLTDITISLWVNPNTLDNNNPLIQYGQTGETTSTNTLYSLKLTSDNRLLYLHEYGSSGTNVEITSDQIPDFNSDNWYHISVTRDISAKRIRFYIDGNQLGEDVLFANVPTGGASSCLWIGGIWGSDDFNGVIDDVKIWNRVLSPAQIKANYQNRSDNVVVYDQTKTGDKWKVTVTPNDNSNNGDSKDSQEVLITAPTLNSVVINSNATDAKSTENLIAVTDDAVENNIKKIYNWQIDDGSGFKPVKVIDIPMDCGATADGNSKIEDYINGYNAIPNNVTYDRFGGFDSKGCYNFNGTDSYLSIDADESVFDLAGKSTTVTMWVKLNPNQTEDFSSILDKGHASEGAKSWYILTRNTEDKISFGYGDGTEWNNAVFTTSPVLDNTWKFLVCVFDQQTLKIYLNGELEDTHNVSEQPADNNYNLEFGMWNREGVRSRFLKGSIDEIKIYNRALSESQIETMYNDYKTTGVFKENIIVADQTRTGEKWRVDVTPSDNFSTGAAKSSNEVNITPITIQEIKLNSGVSNAMSADNLTATVTSDDSERIIYRWEVKEQGKQEYRSLKQLQLPFDGGAVSGKVKDYISNTEWTVNNKALYVGQGGINGTGFYSFDGTENSNIYHNNIPEFDFIHNDFTIEFWVMLNKDQDMGFTGQSDGSGAKNKWMLRYMQTDGGLNWHVNSSSGENSMHTWPWSPETGKIYYISLVRKEDELTLYINGVKQDNDHTIPFEIPGQSGRFYIGHVGENEPVMDGAVDEFTVWQKALSAEQISVMYNNYTTSQTTKRDVITSLVTGNGDLWRVTAIPYDGFSAGEPKTSNEVLVSALSSCKAYKEAGYTEDRLYEIDPDGNGDIAPFVTWCDMTGEGYNLDLNENANTAMRSCREHLTYFPDSHTKDGIYLLDIDGANGDKQPFKAWCDMTTDGGGWTALLNPVDNNLSAAHPDVQATQYESCSNCGPSSALNQDEGENIINIYRCGHCSAWAKLSWTNTIDAKEVMFRAYAHAYNSSSYIYLNGSAAHTATACGSSNKFALGDNTVCNSLLCGSTSWLTSKPPLIRDFTGDLTIQVGGVSSIQNINGCYNHTGWGGGGRIVTVFVREDKRLPEYLPKISCKDHKRSGKTENGIYKIDPDGDGNIAPFEVYCDMTSDDLTILSESSNTGLKSCSEHLRYYPDNKNNDGIYLLDPDGASGETEPFKAWCDMTTEGGGWTLLMNLSNTGTPFGTFNGSTIVNDYWQKTETINDETIAPITDYKSDRAKYKAYNWVNGQEYKLQMLLNRELPSEKEFNWKHKFSNESTAKSIFSGSAQYVVQHLANSCGNYTLKSAPYYDGSIMKFAKGKQAYGFNYNVYSHGANYANAKMKWGFGSNDEPGSNMNAQYGMFYTGSIIWGNASDCDGAGCGCYGTGSSFSRRIGRLWTRDTESDMTMLSAEKSCQHHYLKNRKVDGIYKIDPDGDGPIAEFEAYCDMTTDGGGWTLVHKNDRGSEQANDKTDAGYNLAGLQTPDIDGTAILPREVIEQLGNEFRLTTDSENHKAYWRFSSQNEVFYNTIPDVTDNDIACEMKVVSYDNEWKTAKLIKTNSSDATHVRVQDSEEMHFLVRRDCCGSFGSFWFNNGIWWDDSRPDKGSYHPGMVWVRNNILSAPVISEFNSSAIRVDKGEQITFNWTVTGATKIELLSNNDINFTTPADVTGTTEKAVIPDSSSDIITYTLRTTNNEGFVTERDITIFIVNGIPYSLRFNKSNTNYLQRDVNSSGDRKKWTFSAWVKLVNPGVDMTLLGSSGTDGVRITAEGRVSVVSGNMGHETNEKIQDVDKWHHIYVQINSEHADALERKRIWINGVQSTFVNAITDANFPQDTEGDISQSGKYIYIGKTGNTTVPESDRLSDMYITELFFIDGDLPAIDRFGKDKDGVWTEVSSSVNNYGDNGFYLNFYDQTNIGYDFSGNRNHFTPKGYETSRDGNKYIDQMLDSPTRNFALLLLSKDYNTQYLINQGRLFIKYSFADVSGVNTRINANMSFNNNIYFETKAFRGSSSNTQNDIHYYVGISESASYIFDKYPGEDSDSKSFWISTASDESYISRRYNSGVYTEYGESRLSDNSIISLAVSPNGRKMFVSHNGIWLSSSSPEEGTNPLFDDIKQKVLPVFRPYGYNKIANLYTNFGQGGQTGLKDYKIDITTGVWTEITDGSVPDVRFFYSPPTGFYPLNEAFVSPDISSFTADPTEVSSGSTTDLEWTVTGSVKEELWLDGNKVADITGQSPYTITPPEEPGEYTYTLKTYSSGGLMSSKEVKITVTPAVSVESVQINDNNAEYRSNQRLEAVHTGLNPVDGTLIYNWFVDKGSGSNTIADVIMSFDGNTVNDQSGNNNNGALHDDESDGFNSNGKYGVSYEFDGDNDYIEMPTIGNLFNSDFSYSIWVYIPSEARTGDVSFFNVRNFDDNGTGDHRAGHIVLQPDDNIRFECKGEGDNLFLEKTKSLSLTKDVYLNFVVTKRGNEFRFYYNGNEQPDMRITTSGSTAIDDNNISLGRLNSNTVTGYFKGRIDELMIFDRALSSGQIKSVFDNGMRYIVPSETRVTDKWQVKVIPSDGTTTGEEKQSQQVTITASRRRLIVVETP